MRGEAFLDAEPGTNIELAGGGCVRLLTPTPPAREASACGYGSR
jgi:hypothetical protein